MYLDWGGAPISVVESGVVRQYTRSQVPVVASKYTWEEITSTKRAEMVQDMIAILREEFDRRHLTLVSFGIREVHLPQALQRSLDQKIQAQQAAEQQKYQLAAGQGEGRSGRGAGDRAGERGEGAGGR